MKFEITGIVKKNLKKKRTVSRILGDKVLTPELEYIKRTTIIKIALAKPC